MLYDRWCQIAREFSNELALVDLSSGRQWTFQGLQAHVERQSRARTIGAFPQGASPEFILEVLGAWRAGATLCPLEETQTPVPLHGLPAGCVHLKTTSASTGGPRFIAFTAEQLAADADQIVATMGLSRARPNVGVISLAHSYGFSNLVLPLLLDGIPLVLGASLPESLRQACQVFPHVTVAAVPALWRAWASASVLPENIQLAISAGAPLPLPLELETWNRFGLKIHNFYGASECGGIAYDSSDRPRSDAACAGQPLQGVALALDEAGCLCVRGKAVGLTYWPEPDPALRPGLFLTSDLAALEHGAVYLRGRHADQINVAGRKVSPESIERVLVGHPLVEQCLVFGVPSPDDSRTELIVACVASRATVTIEALKQHLFEQLPAWQLPRAWWFVPELEANARGKLARRLWRQKYLDGQS